MSGDPDPGHAMPPVPKGWTMTRRDDYAGIVLPYFTRKDGISVKFSTPIAAWAAFSTTGERRVELGAAHTPGGMMQRVDDLAPLITTLPADAEDFDALFRGMIMQKLIMVTFRDGGTFAAELTPKGIAALAILECVKAGSAA